MNAQNSPQNQPSKPSMENLPTKRVLSVRERQSLEQSAAIYGYADQAQRGGFIPGSSGAAPVEVPWLAVNRPRLNAQQKEVLRVLKEGSPEPVKPEEKDKLYKLAEDLKEKFTDPEYFQTREEIRVMRRDNPAFFSALEKGEKWRKPQSKLGGHSPEELANAWRNIMRRLEPESDICDSLDRLRKAK